MPEPLECSFHHALDLKGPHFWCPVKIELCLKTLFGLSSTESFTIPEQGMVLEGI
jgi:hypothetical protein